jgi:hypothetical protein
MSFADVAAHQHDKTRFPLTGEHKKLACDKCHLPTSRLLVKDGEKTRRAANFIFTDLPRRDCGTCHVNVHPAGWPENCSLCHSTVKWKKVEEYHKDNPLKGAHTNLGCKECHTSERRLKGQGEECMACHRKDDVHRGMLPNCGDCHSENGFSPTRFKHGMTYFPLRGAHKTLDCQACHRSGVYQGLGTECIFCHMKEKKRVVDPPHNSGAYNDCARCHNEFNFKALRR